MKSAFLLTTATLATASAVAVDARNGTDAASPTRHLSNFLPSQTFRLVGVDIVGKDIGNRGRGTPGECFQFCAGIASEVFFTRCTAATWTNTNGGTCYAKDAAYQTTASAPKAEAESFIIVANTDRTFIWSAMKDGFDMAGFDIGNKPGGSMATCMDLCTANKDCYAVTWTNYKGGTCWLKNRASGYVAKAGAKTAYVARKFDGPQ